MKGLKKIKDFFIDNKIPKSYRDLIPILVDSEDQIIWIMGMRLDDRVKVNSDTKKVLRLKAKIKHTFLQEYF
jgi:tRNA(Ile)-lysidine synthase